MCIRDSCCTKRNWRISKITIRRTACSLPLDGEIRDPVLQIVILDILRGHLSNAIFLQDGAKPYTADDIFTEAEKQVIKLRHSNRFLKFFNNGWNGSS